jgi:hypothetical protein
MAWFLKSSLGLGQVKQKIFLSAFQRKCLCKACFWALRRATVCNLLLPPCEGDGSQRYRKPCKSFELALKHGCGWDLRMGDLSFAEPPDCYELPIRPYENVSMHPAFQSIVKAVPKMLRYALMVEFRYSFYHRVRWYRFGHMPGPCKTAAQW